jgi:hypothetical protein
MVVGHQAMAVLAAHLLWGLTLGLLLPVVHRAVRTRGFGQTQTNPAVQRHPR